MRVQSLFLHAGRTLDTGSPLGSWQYWPHPSGSARHAALTELWALLVQHFGFS